MRATLVLIVIASFLLWAAFVYYIGYMQGWRAGEDDATAYCHTLLQPLRKTPRKN